MNKQVGNIVTFGQGRAVGQVSRRHPSRSTLPRVKCGDILLLIAVTGPPVSPFATPSPPPPPQALLYAAAYADGLGFVTDEPAMPSSKLFANSPYLPKPMPAEDGDKGNGEEGGAGAGGAAGGGGKGRRRRHRGGGAAGAGSYHQQQQRTPGEEPLLTAEAQELNRQRIENIRKGQEFLTRI